MSRLRIFLHSLIRISGGVGVLLALASASIVVALLIAPPAVISFPANLIVAAFFLVLALYWSRFAYLLLRPLSPLAVQHLVGAVHAVLLVLLIRLVPFPTAGQDPGLGPLLLAAGWGVLFFSYRPVSRRLSRFLLPPPSPHPENSAPGAAALPRHD